MFASTRHWTLGLCAWAVVLAQSSAIGVAFSRRAAPLASLPVVSAPPSAVAIRGGGILDTDTEAEATLRRFVVGSKETAGKFHVQGWRWHTMSVMREAERLQKLAIQMDRQEQTVDLLRLKKAADYVLDFNLKALHRVEAMFFPKMREWMNESKHADPEMIRAFDKVVANLEADQKRLAELGKSITNSITGTSINVAGKVAAQTGELLELAKSMLDRETSLVIPAVGWCVPEKDQKKFNNQVIKFLGVLEARVHLVHMHEVVQEANCRHEKQLWEESIPSLPRSMIPRWKRTLYEPKVAALGMP